MGKAFVIIVTFTTPPEKQLKSKQGHLEVVGRELAEADEAEDLGGEEEGDGDGALEEVAHRHARVDVGGDPGVGIGAGQAVLVHGKGREHDLEPELGLGPEDLPERRETARLARHHVAVHLEVNEPLHALRVVPEPVVPVVLCTVDSLRRCAEKRKCARAEGGGKRARQKGAARGGEKA